MNKIELTITVKNMKEYCSKTISCENCKYKKMCALWVNSYRKYTPSVSDVNEMVKLLDVHYRKHYTNNQTFIIHKNDYKFTDECFIYYKHLVRDICKKKGTLMCEEFLHYINFKNYWFENKEKGLIKPRLKKNTEIIDRNTLTFS